MMNTGYEMDNANLIDNRPTNHVERLMQAFNIFWLA